MMTEVKLTKATADAFKRLAAAQRHLRQAVYEHDAQSVAHWRRAVVQAEVILSGQGSLDGYGYAESGAHLKWTGS